MRELIAGHRRTRSTASSPRSRQIKAFRLLPKELDHEDGELTATQKVQALGDRPSASPGSSRRCTGRGPAPDGGVRSTLVRGLGFGSLYALLALGFVIIYKATGDQLRPAGASCSPARRWSPTSSGRLGFYLAVAARGARHRAASALGVERAAMRPMVGRPVFVVAIITLGLDIVDPGRRQRVHRHRRAAGRRPVGAVDASTSSGSRCRSATSR